MRSIWSTIPMVRIFMAVCSGVLLEFLFDFSRPAFLAAAITLFLCLVVVAVGSVVSLSLQFRLRYLQSAILLMCLVCLGACVAWLNTDKNLPSYYGNYLEAKQKIRAEITEPPVIKEKTVTAICAVKGLEGTAVLRNVRGKLLVTFLKDGQAEKLSYGDNILLETKILPLDPPKNPAEFDYKGYQAYHNINYRAFVMPAGWELENNNSGSAFFKFIYQLRDKFQKDITAYVKDENDLAVANAIMLGNRDYMNDDVTNAYAGAGVMHILSVSGMHVGVMFLILNFLLKGMDNRGRKFVVLKAIIIIFFIWLYACLTGLCPSVLRSAIMFTMVQVGLSILRNTNIYNTIAASALLLMLANPFIITQAGFQLSYLAVTGIVFLQPKIQALLAVRSKILNWFWQLTAVSIAAQLITFPLSLYYFHQFPNYFMLANLVVIPVSYLVLVSGVLLFVLSPVPILNSLAGNLFKFSLWVLNKFVFWVEGLPYALQKGVFITGLELILFYLFLLAVCRMLVHRKTQTLLISLTLVLLLFTSFSIRRFKQFQQHKLIVYSVKGHSAIAFLAGHTAYRYFDDGVLLDDKMIKYHIRPSLLESGIYETLPVEGFTETTIGKIVSFNGKNVLFLDKSPNLTGFAVNGKLNVEVVVVSANARFTWEELVRVLNFKTLVFDGSNSAYYVHKQLKQSPSSVKVVDVNTDGAYVSNI